MPALATADMFALAGRLRRERPAVAPTRKLKPPASEQIYKPRLGLNDISVLSGYCYEASLSGG